MSREILFKAKTCSGKWAEGLLAHKDDKWYISNKAGMPFAFEVRPETICQYTGLTDKNDNKIWENDIVKDSDGDIGIIKYGIDGRASFHVYYEKKKDYILLGENNVEMLKIEVIGNIFDNPEVWKGE